MNRGTNIALLVAIAVTAVAAQQLFFAPIREAQGGSWEGEVVSVEPVADGASGSAPLRQALIRLSSGEAVRASVPAGCLVFAGQMTRVARHGDPGTYIVTDNGR